MSTSERLNILTEEYQHIYRLPDTVKPIKYTLTLDPDLQNGTFTGDIIIELEVTQSTRSILLNSHRLTSTNVRVYQMAIGDNNPTKGTQLNVEGVFIQKQRQLMIITLDKPLSPGVYCILLNYHGKLSSESLGLYRTKITCSDGSHRYCVATYFEPTYARFAYPCFDEPHFKAKYCTSLVKPSTNDYIALSNSSVRLEVVDYPRQGVTTVHFDETPPISSYLTCFIVGVFQKLDSVSALSGRVPVSVYSHPDHVEDTVLARDLAAKILDYFSQYFQIDYPFPKLDLIAIPDSKLSGMENWGLITFRDRSLLFSKSESSTSDYLTVVKVVVHELSHMWFGNLVTIAWWNDTWLKEGMADFMSYVGGNYAYPSWFNEWVFLDCQVYRALSKDSALSSRPVISTVSHPDQIREMFDSISYLKGSCIFRMINDLDPSKFRQGLIAYVDKMKWSDARTSDLWECLSETVGWPVGDIMAPWTQQPGYPLITITKEGNNYLLKQKRYLADCTLSFDPSSSPYNFKWDVPVRYCTSENRDKTEYLWFYRDHDSATITCSPNVAWIKLNWHNVGFYRVNYTADMWTTFARLLQDDPSIFDAEDRANLINDAFCLASSGHIKYDLPLTLIMYLKHGTEDNHLVWSVVRSHLEKLQTLLTSSRSSQLFNKYVETLMKPIVSSLQWNTSDDVPYMERKLQVELLSLACLLGFESVLEQVRSLFNDWVEKKTNKLSSEIRPIVHTYGLSGCGNQTEELWEKTWQMYLVEKQPNAIMNLLCALASTNNPDLITRLLSEAKNQDVIRSQDFFIVLSLISKTAVGNKMVWAFIRNEWPYLVCRFSLNAISLGNTVSFVTSHFSTPEQLAEVEEFFYQYPEAGAGSSERKHALESIKANIRWINENNEFLDNWFQKL